VDLARRQRPALDPDVPLVALVDHAGEPVIDPADHIDRAHTDALAQVPELVGQHAGELRQALARDQRQPDRQHEVIGE